MKRKFSNIADTHIEEDISLLQTQEVVHRLFNDMLEFLEFEEDRELLRLEFKRYVSIKEKVNRNETLTTDDELCLRISPFRKRVNEIKEYYYLLLKKNFLSRKKYNNKNILLKLKKQEDQFVIPQF